MSMSRTPIMTSRVFWSESAFPSLDGSVSLQKRDQLASSSSSVSSITSLSSFLDIETMMYLQSLIIRIRRISLKDLKTCQSLLDITFSENQTPGITSTAWLVGLSPINRLTSSSIQGMSETSESVAMMSRWKKNEYLQSSLTTDVIRISIVNRKNEIVSSVKKSASAGFLVSQTRRSSLKVRIKGNLLR